MIYIVSYPRSANTAFRFIIELITGRPTNGVCPGSFLNSRDKLQQPLIHKGRTDFIARKSHSFKGITDKDFVFFILRDPLEAVIRHNERPRGLSEQSLKNYIDSYFELTELYDTFEGQKMMIYYDRLVEIAFPESRAMYPNAQSNSPNYHKNKLPDDVRIRLDDYIRTKHSELYVKYLQ